MSHLSKREAEAIDWAVQRRADGEAINPEFQRWLAEDETRGVELNRALTLLSLVQEVVQTTEQVSLEERPREQQASGEQASRELACGEQASREQASRELASGEPPSNEQPRTPRRAALPRILAMAASVVVVLIGVIVFFARQPASSRVLTCETPIGGYQRTDLPDGSVVELNTNTKVTVPPWGATRDVSLLNGEAYFTVAHDRQRPFLVHTGDTTVRAVGTRFVVRVYPDGMSVLVTEGAVHVDVAGGIDVAKGDRLVVRDVVGGRDVSLIRVASTFISRAEMWRSRKIAIEQEPLAEAVAEMNRYNSRPIVIRDPRIANIKIGGTFSVDDQMAFVSALRSIAGVQYLATDQRIELFSLDSQPGRVGGKQ